MHTKLTLLLLLFSVHAGAQPPGARYSHPPFSNSWYPSHMPMPGHSPTISQKHHFHIVFVDGKDTVLYTRLIADSMSEYLVLENRSVSKKDSGRYTRINPSQTRSISHVNVLTGQDYIGQPNDSCWLFKVIEGKINAYTALAEISVDDEFLLYVQAGAGPLIAIADPKALDLFSANVEAANLFVNKKYNKALKKYNSARD
jgi:hypothetical protein